MSRETGPSPKAVEAIKKFEEEQKQEAETRKPRENAVDAFAMEAMENTRESLEKQYDGLVTEILFDADLSTDQPEGKAMYDALMQNKEDNISATMRRVAKEQLPLDQAAGVLKDMLSGPASEERRVA